MISAEKIAFSMKKVDKIRFSLFLNLTSYYISYISKESCFIYYLIKFWFAGYLELTLRCFDIFDTKNNVSYSQCTIFRKESSMNKISILALVLFAGLSFGYIPSAVWETVEFSWSGDNGYRLAGSMTYDDDYGTISYSNGSGSGISDFSVNFYDSSNQFIGSFSNIVNKTVNYSAFTIIFDTDALTFGNQTDIVAFGSKIYTFQYTTSASNFILNNAQTSETLDSSSQGLTVAPEPASIALLGLGGLFIRRLKKS